MLIPFTLKSALVWMTNNMIVPQIIFDFVETERIKRQAYTLVNISIADHLPEKINNFLLSITGRNFRQETAFC